MNTRPQPDEYGGHYGMYIERVPQGRDIFACLNGQPDELKPLLTHVSDDQASAQSAPGEWSIKEVVGHLCDAERSFAYKALCIARGDTITMIGFDQNAYVAAANYNARRLSDLLDEFGLQRRANVLSFQPMTETDLRRRVIASDSPISVRALLYVIAGHVLHHIESLKTDYKVG